MQIFASTSRKFKQNPLFIGCVALQKTVKTSLQDLSLCMFVENACKIRLMRQFI